MTYQAGIIGTGGIAGMGILGLHEEEQIGNEKFRASHAGGYHANERVELVAASDVDEDKLERFGEAWEFPSAHRYTSHREMLASEDLDIVSVCTPTLYHHRHVVDTVRSDATPDVVWCEKPIASSVTEANEMISACDEAGTELVVNHSFRFTDKIQQLAEAIDDGLVGEVKSVTAQFRRELLRNSTHLIDTLVYLLDARAITVYGYLNQENDAVTTLEGGEDVDDVGGGGMVILEDGTMVLIDCTIAREYSSMNLQLLGTEGKLAINNDDGEWRYWTLRDGDHFKKPTPATESGWDWEIDYRAAFPNAVDHVVDVLEGEADNLSPGRSALRSLEVIAGFFISHYTGGRVSIPLDRPLEDVTVTSW
jgi:predicted dehydrogenase